MCGLKPCARDAPARNLNHLGCRVDAPHRPPCEEPLREPPVSQPKPRTALPRTRLAARRSATLCTASIVRFFTPAILRDRGRRRAGLPGRLAPRQVSFVTTDAHKLLSRHRAGIDIPPTRREIILLEHHTAINQFGPWMLLSKTPGRLNAIQRPVVAVISSLGGAGLLEICLLSVLSVTCRFVAIELRPSSGI